MASGSSLVHSASVVWPVRSMRMSRAMTCSFLAGLTRWYAPRSRPGGPSGGVEHVGLGVEALRLPAVAEAPVRPQPGVAAVGGLVVAATAALKPHGVAAALLGLGDERLL